MSAFNTNRNAFLSSIQTLKTDFHAFDVVGVPKGSKTAKQQKRAMIASLRDTLDQIETDDVGIRILIVKTKH